MCKYLHVAAKKCHHVLYATRKIGVLSADRSRSLVKVQSKKPEKVMSLTSVIQREHELLTSAHLFVFTGWRPEPKPQWSPVASQICSTRGCHAACVVRGSVQRKCQETWKGMLNWAVKNWGIQKRHFWMASPLVSLWFVFLWLVGCLYFPHLSIGDKTWKLLSYWEMKWISLWSTTRTVLRMYWITIDHY